MFWPHFIPEQGEKSSDSFTQKNIGGNLIGEHEMLPFKEIKIYGVKNHKTGPST